MKYPYDRYHRIRLPSMDIHPAKSQDGLLFDVVDSAHVPERCDEKVWKLIRQLSLREQVILFLRYGIGGCNYSLQDIARIFKITRERVRQIEMKSLMKLHGWY